MTRPTDRFTLAAIVAAAVLAASLVTTWTPSTVASAPLTWATVYTAAVMSLAKLVHLPPARTLFAATLLTAVAIQIALTGLRHAIDQAITGLAYLQAAGTNKLATPHLKAA
ncbi:hypothetical protein [Streptomyces sp. SID4982]|uniref:hypothetical protein n=1 Tax=Streptomyces sp. SID4982 TaxID=2690291 RepID=UPI00136EF9D1|nr:hypothetical protein [Streptomyces sp. SID4982]MYS18077.1 hypothetical protein [Streptomyces sp. SID4982]